MDIQKKFERAFQKAEINTRTQGQKRTISKDINFSHDGVRHTVSYIVEKERDQLKCYWVQYMGRNRLNGQEFKSIEEIDSNLSINDNIDLEALINIAEDKVKVEVSTERKQFSYK